MVWNDLECINYLNGKIGELLRDLEILLVMLMELLCEFDQLLELLCHAFLLNNWYCYEIRSLKLFC